MKVFTSATPGGEMARRFFPMALLVPLALGALRIYGERAGYYAPELGVSLFVTATVFVFAGLIVWNAQLLYRAEIARLRNANRLAVQYKCTQVLADTRSIRAAAWPAFGSPRVRPSHSSSIMPDMIIA